MEAIQNKTTNKIVGIKNAGWVIICCFIIAVCIYHFILGNPSNFMNNDAGDMKKAQELCDKQGGSVANVVTSTLRKYADVENDATLSKDQKVLAIQKELEEATALELPMMEQKLPNMHSALKM